MCDESYENDDYRCVIADFCAQFGDTMCKHGTCLIHKESCFCDSDYQTVGDDSSSYVLPPLKYNWTTLIYKHTACIKKRCSKKQIDGFVVALHSPYFYFGESIIIYDRNTHHVKGVETCDINYQWEHSLKNKCEAPTGVDRYTPVLSEYPLYTEVTVACEDLVQKHLLGPQRIVCLKGGWSYESMCRWHQCADPQLNGVNFTVRNQALGYTYNFGVILDLFCENADEKLEGNPSMECIAGHSNLQPVKWDRERKPYCKKKFECELRVGNGVLASAEGLMIGESANFACIQPNYVLSNPNPVTCVKKPRLTRSNRCIAQWNAPDYVILNASASFYCELLQECSELKIRWISHQTPGRFKNFRSGNSAFGTIQKVQDGDQGVYTCDVVDFNGELADQITVHLNINHNGTAGTNTNVFGPVSMIEVPNVSIYSPHLDQPVPECIDQQPMQLECLSELHLEQRQSGSIKPISVPWPTVKDNDPNIQISSSLIGLTAQPYTFNGKEKEIRWLSSDQHGNQAACVTKLIVEGVHRVTAC